MNCYFHPEQIAVVQCRKCKKQLCENCYDPEIKDYCYSCSVDLPIEKTASLPPKSMTTNWNGIRKAIGWYEIIGGAIGLLLILFLTFRIDIFSNAFATLIYIIFSALFLVSMLAGYSVLKNKNYGFSLSIIIQLLQSIQFILKGTYFSFLAGAQLTFQFFGGYESGFKFKFGAFSEFNLHINSGIYGWLISINIVPLIIIYYLMKMRSNERYEMDNGASSQQG